MYGAFSCILVHSEASWCILAYPRAPCCILVHVFLAVLLSSPGLCWAAVAGEEKLRLDGHSCRGGLGQARLGSCLARVWAHLGSGPELLEDGTVVSVRFG